MAHLDEVINKGLIKLDLKGKNKKEVIEELTDLLVKEKKLSSRSEFIARVYEREATMPTYCGVEVAIPHALSSAVVLPTVCFGRSKGFYWDSEDELVRFVFLFAMPEADHDSEHISIMSAVARCCLDPKIRDLWLHATTEEQILEPLRSSVDSMDSDDATQDE